MSASRISASGSKSACATDTPALAVRRIDRPCTVSGWAIDARRRRRERASVVVAARHHRDELVACEARGDPSVADTVAHAMPELDEHLVTDRVAVAVVDALEVVEVEEHDGDGLGALEAVGEEAVEGLSIGEPGEAVGGRGSFERSVGVVLRGHVAHVDDEAVDAGDAEQVGDRPDRLALGALRWLRSEGELDGLSGSKACLAERGGHDRGVVGMDVGHDRRGARTELTRGASRQGLHRLTEERGLALGVEQDEHLV